MPDSRLYLPAAVSQSAIGAVDQSFEGFHANFDRRLIGATDGRVRETGGHGRRIGLFAGFLAHRLGWTARQVDTLERAAALHDVGKQEVPPHLLAKPGALTEAEMAVVRRHTVIGHRMLSWSDHPVMQQAATIALSHHERWDGTGYPHRLNGSAIPVAARIVALADTYDALRMERCYKPAMDHRRTVEIILDGDERTRPEHFDPLVLTAFHSIHFSFRTVYPTHRD